MTKPCNQLATLIRIVGLKMLNRKKPRKLWTADYQNFTFTHV